MAAKKIGALVEAKPRIQRIPVGGMHIKRDISTRVNSTEAKKEDPFSIERYLPPAKYRSEVNRTGINVRNGENALMSFWIDDPRYEELRRKSTYFNPQD